MKQITNSPRFAVHSHGILFFLHNKTPIFATEIHHTTMNRVLFLLYIALMTAANLRAEDIPTDTLLMDFYERAANLMGEGYYEEAQHSFDSAFAVKGVEQSPVYPILLNEQATLLIYVGKNEEAFEMKKSVLPYLPQTADLEKHISVYNDLAILYRQRHMSDSTIYYYNKALEAALKYKDESWITHIYNNVSVFYFNIRQLSEAEKYNELAIQHVSKTDDAYVNFSAWQLGAGIKAELNKIEKAEQFIRKAWQIACNAGENTASLKIRCMPSILRVFERQEKPDSVDYYLQMGNRLLADIPANSVPAIGFIQVRASTEMNRKNYSKALNDLLWLRNRNIGSEPKTLLTQIAQCYDAIGNRQLAYVYMDSARMWTDTLAQHNLTQQMAEFNVKYQTQEKELQIAHLQQEKLEHETFLLKITVAAGCLLALAFIALLILYYKKRIADKKIELLKQENELNSAKRYIEGLEAECKYFAKELHDGIANDLLGLQMKIESSATADNLQKLGSFVSQLRNNVRNISHELMPPEFDQLSLDEILGHYAASLTENTGRHIAYTPTAGNASRFIPNRTAYELYRIVQELTMNAVKHTDASRIDINLQAESRTKYTLRITDNGTPYTSQSPHNGRGIGLRTVDDRIKAIHAQVSQQTSDGNNCFTLQLEIPQNEQEEVQTTGR